MELIKPYIKNMCKNSNAVLSLRDARIISGITAKHVAKSIGISPSLLYQYERNPESTSTKAAKKLARVYQIPLDAIKFVSQ